MPTPPYILDIRRTYGQGRLLLPGVDAVVVREDLDRPGQHLLLVRRADTGRWSLPAGIVEPGEQPAATLVREVMEEACVVVQPERLSLVSMDPDLTYPNGDVCQFLSMTFRCRYVAGEARVGDEESTEVGWFPVDDLPPGLTPLLQRRIATALENRPECVFDR